MQITKEEIIEILNKVKACVDKGEFRISLNPNRVDNVFFIDEYRLTSEKQKNMIIALNKYDFSKIEKDRNNNYETLYFFGKVYELNHKDRGIENVEAYIKFTIKQRKTGELILFISFHKAKWPIDYYFKNN